VEYAAFNKTGAQRLVEHLIDHEVSTIFAVPGQQLDPIFSALHKVREKIKIIHTRHEQGAAYMAYGYARSTGKIGVCMVPPGPGLLNATAGLATGFAGNTPIFCIAGQIPSDMIGRGLGVLHEIPDQLAILKGLTKWAARADNNEAIDIHVTEAFTQLTSGRPRPVGIEIPCDVLDRNGEYKSPPLTVSPARPACPEYSTLQQAVDLLLSAKQPMIYVGGGAVDAGKDLQALAEWLNAPVVSHCSGKGILSDRHPLSVPLPVGHALWASVDVVLVVGSRFLPPKKDWGLDEHIKVIRIDIDAEELYRGCTPDIGWATDAALAIKALREELQSRSVPRIHCDPQLLASKNAFSAACELLQPQRDYLNAIRAALPDDGIFVDELTQIGYVSRVAYPVYKPRTYIPATYQGALGFGFATGIGAKVGNPDTPVVSISGDGGILYTISELATAVQHRIPLVSVIFNDNAFGNIKRVQQAEGFTLGTDLHNPNFVALAQAFGACGIAVDSPDQLHHALIDAFKRHQPTVIEVNVGEMPSPWHLLRLSRVSRARPV